MKNSFLTVVLGLFTVTAVALATDEAALPTLPKLKLSDPLPSGLFVELNKLVNPAVVNIFTSSLPRGRNALNDPDRDPFFDMFDQFMGPGGPSGREEPMPQQSLGSGFLIREDGLILTNNHVVEEADLIKVQIEERGKESFVAKVIGRDQRSDIALIKIEAHRKLPFLRMGSSGDVQVGEWVAAFGNPFGWGHSMTKGIISALGRELEDINLNPFMQTDASINPGNSGGPLVNTQGLVIGVNTAVDKRAQGIGFVIPIDAVKAMLPSLEKDGSVKRGFIGVRMQDNLDPETARSLGVKNAAGVLIVMVEDNTPAARAGMMPGDFVTEFNGQAIENHKDLAMAVIRTPVGETVTAKLLRRGVSHTVKVTVSDGSELKTGARAKPTPKIVAEETIVPYNLGFTLVDYTPALASRLPVPPLRKAHPVILSVEPESEASRVGLVPGDIIIDVNRREVTFVREAVSQLRRGTINILKVAKPGRMVLVSLRAS